MNNLIQNVTALTDFINKTLLGLDCAGDLYVQVDDSLNSFGTIINDILINIDSVLKTELTEEMATNMTKFKDYLSNLKNMIDSFTITDAVDTLLLTDVILILINTSFILIEVLETLIGTDIANGELCGEIGSKIDAFLNQCVCEKLSLFHKILCSWQELLKFWISSISNIGL